MVGRESIGTTSSVTLCVDSKAAMKEAIRFAPVELRILVTRRHESLDAVAEVSQRTAKNPSRSSVSLY